MSVSMESIAASRGGAPHIPGGATSVAASVEIFRLPKEPGAVAKIGGPHHWILSSDKPHDETPEFDSFNAAQPRPATPPLPSAQVTVGGGPTSRPDVTHVRIAPPPDRQPYGPLPSRSKPFEVPQWLAELFAFKRQPTPLPPLRLAPGADPDKLGEAQDLMTFVLLRMCHVIREKGDLRAKLMLAPTAPPNELKDLLQTATDLAVDIFSVLPPFLGVIPPSELTNSAGITDGEMATGDYDVFALGAVLPSDSHSLPHSVISLSASSALASSAGVAHSAPVMPSALSLDIAPPDAQLAGLPYGQSGLFHASCPPRTGAGPETAGRAAFAPSPFLRGVDRRGSADLFPSHAKKPPAVGDRPLTPPAHGWHAKYSSGVTGVVWDRVHQAWVVSWTLAGKRTFRHFTCKSYGGFDKAREAAIEFRLARNRDIAAYNKRSKERRG